VAALERTVIANTPFFGPSCGVFVSSSIEKLPAYGQDLAIIRSALRKEKKLFITALSKTLPDRLIGSFAK